jgi:hypothetical protein
MNTRIAGAIAVTLATAAIGSPHYVLAATSASARDRRSGASASANTTLKRSGSRIVLSTRASSGSACPAFLKGHCPASLFGKHLRTRSSGEGHDGGDGGGRGGD